MVVILNIIPGIVGVQRVQELHIYTTFLRIVVEVKVSSLSLV